MLHSKVSDLLDNVFYAMNNGGFSYTELMMMPLKEFKYFMHRINEKVESEPKSMEINTDGRR